MFPFSGRGWAWPVAFGIGLFGGFWLLEWAARLVRREPTDGWHFLVSLGCGTLLAWAVTRRWLRSRVVAGFDSQTGQPLRRMKRHTLYWIPVEVWCWIALVATGVTAVLLTLDKLPSLEPRGQTFGPETALPAQIRTRDALWLGKIRLPEGTVLRVRRGGDGTQFVVDGANESGVLSLDQLRGQPLVGPDEVDLGRLQLPDPDQPLLDPRWREMGDEKADPASPNWPGRPALQQPQPPAAPAPK